MNHQPEATLRLDPSTGPSPVPTTDSPTLPEGWISLSDCLLEPRPVEGMPANTILVPMALLHPEFGVALLGVPGAVAEAAAAAFRKRLEDARFPAIFPGHLPVVTLAMLPGEQLNLRRRLAAAFAAVPPLDLAGGDGWITLVGRLLQTRPLVRPPSPGPRRQRSAPPRQAAVAAHLAEPARFASPNLPWRNFAPMLGLAGGGLLIGLVLGLNHTPSEPQQTGTEAPARPVSSASPPPSPRAEAPALQPPPPQRQASLPPPPVAPAPAPTPAPAPPAIIQPPADPAAGSAGLPRVLVRSAANLRAGPDSSAPILRTAARGEAFRVHGEARGGWIQVGGSAPEGWIHSSLLTEP
ncbi:SH3 domain-containing protein [Belnapia sp. T18]|uniref:SH3 domain-containing protein n=1 Tax=Belnapia arida TaxID=2804533 RepID=A0ABS1U2M3_9PROT|nr:SH3 domain-containing protein [Belnapia arida]MBL6078931.1 SH3 domain-containing protein [Belnapia arida]